MKPQRFSPEYIKCLDELGSDAYSNFIRNLENGDTVGYMADLGNFPEVFNGETKRRVYDEQRQFLGNYKTDIWNVGFFTKVIGGGSEYGLLSGTFSESEMVGKYQNVLLNSLGGGVEDIARTAVRALVYDAQWVSTSTSGIQCDRRSLVLPALCVLSAT